MKKILALMICTTLFVTSSISVFATEGTDATTPADSAGTPTVEGSVSKDVSDLKEEVKDLTDANKKQAEAIEELTKQVQNLTKAVQASQNNKGGGGQPPKRTSGSGGNSTDYRNYIYAVNNAVGYGSNTVAQGGHVEINGGKSNVTFVITAPTNGEITSANSLAASVGGALLNTVRTSSPGVAFSTAKVNFYVSGVVVGDNIAVYQLQNGKWVQLPTAEIRKDHVVVLMTKHGTLAFVRVPVLASTG